jgi:hypothetical protein
MATLRLFARCVLRRFNFLGDLKPSEQGSLGPLYIRAHLELSPLGLEVGLNFKVGRRGGLAI